MEYIYDIVLNFNDCYYEFYEWNNKDKIIVFSNQKVLAKINNCSKINHVIAQ